jgi:hypothetical protein
VRRELESCPQSIQKRQRITSASQTAPRLPVLIGPLRNYSAKLLDQLPFDVFIVRKVKKWEERASAWNVDLTEVIGVSPLAEMMYLWNGLKKCDRGQLQKVLDIIQFSRASNPEKHETNVDERAIHFLIRATCLRGLGRFEDAREILKTEVLSHDK